MSIDLSSLSSRELDYWCRIKYKSLKATFVLLCNRAGLGFSFAICESQLVVYKFYLQISVLYNNYSGFSKISIC